MFLLETASWIREQIAEIEGKLDAIRQELAEARQTHTRIGRASTKRVRRDEVDGIEAAIEKAKTPARMRLTVLKQQLEGPDQHPARSRSTRSG